MAEELHVYLGFSSILTSTRICILYLWCPNARFFLDNCSVLYIKNFENIHISKSHFWGGSASNRYSLYIKNKHFCNLLDFFQGFLILVMYLSLEMCESLSSKVLSHFVSAKQRWRGGCYLFYMIYHFLFSSLSKALERRVGKQKLIKWESIE